jgi:protein involved in polysaccharide export with SLBB domain
MLALTGCQQGNRISVQEFLMKYPDAALPSADAIDIGQALSSRTDYFIGSGDVLGITIYGLEKPEESNTYNLRVSRSGTLILPRIGEINVSDMPPQDAEQAINAQYAGKLRQPRTLVVIQEYQENEVFVMGGVRAPGVVRLRRNEQTLIHALLAAGGLAPNATGDLKITRLSRMRQASEAPTTQPADAAEKSPLPVDSINIRTPEGLAMAYMPLGRGDVITADQGPAAVFVTGVIDGGGILRMPSDGKLNVLQAFAMAGGTDPYVDPKDMTLVRTNPDGGPPIRVKLDIRKIRTGIEHNLQMAAGDVLIVNPDLESVVNQFIRDNVRISAGINATWSPILEFYRHQDRKEDRNRQFTRTDQVGQAFLTGLTSGSLSP